MTSGPPESPSPDEPSGPFAQPAAPSPSGPEHPPAGYLQPGPERSGFEQPAYQQPGYQQPGYQQPSYPPPGYQQPGYQQPGYPPSAYPQPGYPQPGYSEPGYPQPGYGYPPQPQGYPPQPYGYPQSYAQQPYGQQPYAYAPPHQYGQPYGYVAPTPGIIPLKFGGLAVSDYFSAIAAGFRRDWRSLLGLSALVNGVSTVLSLVLAGGALVTAIPALRDLDLPPDSVEWTSEQNHDFLMQVIVPLIPFFVAYLFLMVCTRSLLCALTSVVTSEDTVGRQIGVGDALRRLRPVWGRVLVLGLVSSISVLLGIALCIIPGLVLMTFWSVATPALVNERAGVWTSLRRSWDLVRGSFWRVLGIRTLTFLAVSTATQLVSRSVQAGVPSFGPDATVTSFLLWIGLIMVVQYVLSVATSVIGPMAQALIYVDMRIRKDDLLGGLLAGRSPADVG